MTAMGKFKHTLLIFAGLITAANGKLLHMWSLLSIDATLSKILFDVFNENINDNLTFNSLRKTCMRAIYPEAKRFTITVTKRLINNCGLLCILMVVHG
jgi:hypothetical protein